MDMSFATPAPAGAPSTSSGAPTVVAGTRSTSTRIGSRCMTDSRDTQGFVHPSRLHKSPGMIAGVGDDEVISGDLLTRRCVGKLRTAVTRFINGGQHRNAVYWSDKLYALSSCMSDYVTYLQCLLAGQEWDRAYDSVHTANRGLELRHVLFKWLALRCLYSSRRYEEAVFLAESPVLESPSSSSSTTTSKNYNNLNLINSVSTPSMVRVDTHPGTGVSRGIGAGGASKAPKRRKSGNRITIHPHPSLLGLDSDGEELPQHHGELPEPHPFSTRQPGEVIGQLSPADIRFLDAKAAELNVEAGIRLLSGRLYEVLDNKKQAIDAYRQALALDIFCVEALERLVDQCLITPTDEADLLSHLPWTSLSDPEDAEDDQELKDAGLEQSEGESDLEFEDQQGLGGTACKSKGLVGHLVHYLYHAKTNKFLSREAEEIMPPIPCARQLTGALKDNPSVLAAKAQRLFYLGDVRGAMTAVDSILAREELHSEALPVQICLLVDTKECVRLFSLAHRLIDLYPTQPISWYAVGAYYYSVEMYNAAKRFFQKATALDANYGPAWLAYGHSLAVMAKHDQAMNCYLRAARVMRGCHLPQLYIGLEYCLTNNNKLGEQFFACAYALAPRDPHVLHEMGVMAFRAGSYEVAESHFTNALTTLETLFGPGVALPPQWEPLLNNLGHVSRKLKKYSEALKYHQRALVMVPKCASTLAAIGFVHLLLARPDEAITDFHKSLSLKRDAKQVTALLSKAVELTVTVLSNRVNPCLEWDDPPSDLPLPTLSDRGVGTRGSNNNNVTDTSGNLTGKASLLNVTGTSNTTGGNATAMSIDDSDVMDTD